MIMSKAMISGHVMLYLPGYFKLGNGGFAFFHSFYKQ